MLTTTSGEVGVTVSVDVFMYPSRVTFMSLAERASTRTVHTCKNASHRLRQKSTSTEGIGQCNLVLVIISVGSTAHGPRFMSSTATVSSFLDLL